uniref:Large ribosomal subunit protein uL30m n=1 Tax=Ciona savignyi TaxID=51511 RepID=H2YE87_CIOSA
MLRIRTRNLHTTLSKFVRNSYPLKPSSITGTAKKLGFKNAQEMYPEYPLDETPKLWMIIQVQRLKYRPYWEKEAMRELGLYSVNDVSIQINSPNMNEVLWSIKHLIKIQPIRMTQGEPTKDDIGYTQLKWNGEFEIKTKIQSNDDPKNVVPIAPEEEWKVVDGFRMCNNCRQKRCLAIQMCQKLWFQQGKNNLERIGPQLFNFVENPLKHRKT